MKKLYACRRCGVVIYAEEELPDEDGFYTIICPSCEECNVFEEVKL